MDYQEAGSWTKDSSNFDNLSNDELRGAMHSFDGMAKQQNKIGDEESAAWKRPEGDYGDTPQTSGHRAATEYASARDRVGYALQNRKQKEHSTDSDDALQSGHMDKKKGRK